MKAAESLKQSRIYETLKTILQITKNNLPTKIEKSEFKKVKTAFEATFIQKNKYMNFQLQTSEDFTKQD